MVSALSFRKFLWFVKIQDHSERFNMEHVINEQGW